MEAAVQETPSQRLSRFGALCQKYWIPLLPEGPWPNGSAEDAASVLSGETPLRRWACVTASGSADIIYRITTFDTYAEASAYSCENVNNDLFRESPEALCDLDSANEPWGRLYLLRSVHPQYVPAFLMAEYAIVIEKDIDVIWLRDVLEREAQKHHDRWSKATQGKAAKDNAEKFECFSRYAQRLDHIHKQIVREWTTKLGVEMRET